MEKLTKDPFNLVIGDKITVKGFSFDRGWSSSSHVDTEGVVVSGVPEQIKAPIVTGLSSK